jgi:hypothetical protein
VILTTHTRGITDKAPAWPVSSWQPLTRRSDLSDVILKLINWSIAQCDAPCFDGSPMASSSKLGRPRLLSTPCSMALATHKVGGGAGETHNIAFDRTEKLPRKSRHL